MLFLCAVYSQKYSQKFANHWPILGMVKDIFARNFETLQALVPSGDNVIDLMERYKCLTPEQLTSIRSVADGQRRSRRLLDFLRRSDTATYNKFIRCMIELQQTEVVTLMTENSGKRYFLQIMCCSSNELMVYVLTSYAEVCRYFACISQLTSQKEYIGFILLKPFRGMT
jgi:hypothetical protein